MELCGGKFSGNFFRETLMEIFMRKFSMGESLRRGFPGVWRRARDKMVEQRSKSFASLLEVWKLHKRKMKSF
jgi:hypothetical protein